MFSRRQRSPVLVGLDLDPSHIAAAEVVVNGRLSVSRAALGMLGPGVLQDGEVSDPTALTEALQNLFAEHELSPHVRIGVANQRLVVRTLDLPPATKANAVAAAVYEQAPDHIPMPMDEAILDFQQLGVVETSRGPRTRVVVVAARREMVKRLADAVTAAGLVVEGIDLSAFAMARAIGVAGPGARLYVNVAGLTNVAVASESAVLFARAASGGFEGIAHTLAERRALTLEHARQWMAHVGLVAPLATIEGDPVLVAATRSVLEDGVHQIANAVRSSVEYYRSQESAEVVQECLVTGPAISIAGFAEALGAQLHIPVTSAVVGATEGVEDLTEPGRLSVAAGLAVEERDLSAAR
jgi:type IV pilus assembly protein PilM